MLIGLLIAVASGLAVFIVAMLYVPLYTQVASLFQFVASIGMSSTASF
jgi:DHA1 family bicyclomycin/chloramphenicol resistance-like MFS transporter